MTGGEIKMASNKPASSSNFMRDFKRIFLSSLNVNTYFIVLFSAIVIVDGWYDLHINANDILMGYSIIVGKNVITHGINSVLNSKSGEMPVKPNQFNAANNNMVDKK